MKTIKLTILLFIALAVFNTVPAQSIKGKIVDEVSLEPLVGALIKVEGTSTGALSDVDGTYSVENLKPGNYNLLFSFIGFNSKHIKNVKVESDKVTVIDVVLTVNGLTTEEIVVEATSSLANENSLLAERKNSDKVTDGISSQQIKKSSDAAASDVLKRINGVTVVDDKFVFVRGTSERYNNTMLNGVLLPSTEPDKKTFSFDLFPSSLLENIIISKTFTPEQPGNYSGGLVQINTKDFPEAFTYSYSLSGGFNSNTSTQTFYGYDASNMQLGFINLGIDNSRMLPSVIPSSQMKNTNFNRDDITLFSRSFSNNWGQNPGKAPLNSAFQLSVGNSFNLGKFPIGLFAAYTYKNSFSNKEVTNNEYNTDNTQLSGYNGRNSETAVLWGGMLNLNIKLNSLNKLSLKSTYTLNSEDETQFYEGFASDQANYDKRLYLTKFTQRDLISTQLEGEHYLKTFSNITLNWRASYSASNRQEPDIKTMTYQRTIGTQEPFFAALNPNFGNTYAGGRFFSDMKDINRGISMDVEIPFKLPLAKNINARTKLGFLVNGTQRNFNARNFGVGYYIGMPFDILYQPIESIFKSDNFDNNKLFYDELTNETDKYNAEENIYAGYLMFDVPVKKFRFIIGARYENNEQKVNTLGIIGNPVTNNLKSTDILPSINVIYKPRENTNIRAAYSQTLSRPELREIAPFSYVDFISGNLIFGNSVDLRRTLVRNYDLRYEWFPKAGEIVSVSAFYKQFDAPIEEVFIPTSTNRLVSFKNAENGAQNYGMEFEFRKRLDFISKQLSDFSFNTNIALINSKIDLAGTGSVESKTERRMQGQSPFMINAGLFYENTKTGTGINLIYNRVGDIISKVGLNGFEDIRELGRDLLDIVVSQKLLNKFEFKFAVRDVLNNDRQLVQSIDNSDKIVKNIKGGTNYSLTLSYKY